MTLHDYTKKFTDLFRKKSRPQFTHDPYSDWQVIMSIMTIILIAVVVIDGYIFYKIDRGELFKIDTKSASTIPQLDRKLLDEENAYYDSRESTYNNLRSQPPAVIDPAE